MCRMHACAHAWIATGLRSAPSTGVFTFAVGSQLTHSVGHVRDTNATWLAGPAAGPGDLPLDNIARESCTAGCRNSPLKGPAHKQHQASNLECSGLCLGCAHF